MPELETAWPATAKALDRMKYSEHEEILRALRTGVARLSKQDGYVAHTQKHTHTNTHTHTHTHTHSGAACRNARTRGPTVVMSVIMGLKIGKLAFPFAFCLCKLTLPFACACAQASS